MFNKYKPNGDPDVGDEEYLNLFSSENEEDNEIVYEAFGDAYKA